MNNVSTLSVVVPAYNASKYLAPVLQAILQQSFQPLEVIVVDDGSTDRTLAVLEQQYRHVPTVKVLRNERNSGVVFSLHRGLEVAVGDYVYFASTSDRVFPAFFEKSMRLLAEHPQAALSCADFVLFYSQGPQFVYRLRWALDPCFMLPRALAAVIREKGGYIPGATSITKRSVLLESGGFIPELGGQCDWFNSLVSGFRHGVCYIPEPLAAFRLGEPGSVSAAHRSWNRQRYTFDHLFELLKSDQYKDVASEFKSSAALSCLPSILRALLSDSARWSYLSPSLVRRALWIAARRLLVQGTPMKAKDIALRLRRLAGIVEPTYVLD